MSCLKKIKAKSSEPLLLIFTESIKPQYSTYSPVVGMPGIQYPLRRTCVLFGQKCGTHSAGLRCPCLVRKNRVGSFSREQ